MNYQRFDIVMLRPEFGAKIYAIVELTPGRPKQTYVGVKLDRGPLTKRYLLGDEQILAKIGTLAPEALMLDAAAVQTAVPEHWQLGQHHARFMAEHAPTELDRWRWALLAGLEPGDPVPIRRFTRHGAHIEQHRFQEVLPSGQKYHFAAMNPNGTVYKWTLESLALGSDKATASDLDIAAGEIPEDYE